MEFECFCGSRNTIIIVCGVDVSGIKRGGPGRGALGLRAKEHFDEIDVEYGLFDVQKGS